MHRPKLRRLAGAHTRGRRGYHEAQWRWREITDHPDSTLRLALSTSELALLDAVSPDAGDERARWFTRFWASKEAAAKAEGTGLDGNPHRFTITAATPASVTVEIADRSYHVKHREVRNPEGLSMRTYIVAWTWGPEPESRRDRTVEDPSRPVRINEEGAMYEC